MQMEGTYSRTYLVSSPRISRGLAQLVSEWMGEQCRPGGVQYPVGLWGWLCKLNLTSRIGRKGDAQGSIGYLQRACLRCSPSQSRPTRATPTSQVSQGESPRARSTSTPAASSAGSPTPRSSTRAAASGTRATSSIAPPPPFRALISCGTGTARR